MSTRIEETTVEVVDIVLSYIGQGKGGPHDDVTGILRTLVAAELDDVLKQIRTALNSSRWDSAEGLTAGQELVEKLLAQP